MKTTSRLKVLSPIVLAAVLAWPACGLLAAEKAAAKSKTKQPPPSVQSTTEAPTRIVTGSYIPCQVDASGCPVNSTLKVTVIDQKTIRVLNAGNPIAALRQLPMVSTRGY